MAAQLLRVLTRHLLPTFHAKQQNHGRSVRLRFRSKSELSELVYLSCFYSVHRFPRYAESGIVQAAYRCVLFQGERTRSQQNLRAYKTLDAYVEEHSGFSDLDLSNFRNIFGGHFALLAIYLVAFLVSKRKGRRVFRRSVQRLVSSVELS